MRPPHGRARQRSAARSTTTRATSRRSPPEILERDYGCGDPSRHVRAGRRRARPRLRRRQGLLHRRAESSARGPRHRRRLQRRDARARAQLPARGGRAARLRQRRVPPRPHPGPRARPRPPRRVAREHPVGSSTDLARSGAAGAACAATAPLVADERVDVVVSNCVLNLVREADSGSCSRRSSACSSAAAASPISDIVSDEAVPDTLKGDPSSGAAASPAPSRSASSSRAFEAAGFHGIDRSRGSREPWRDRRGDRVPLAHRHGAQGQAGAVLGAQPGGHLPGAVAAVEDDDGHVLGAACGSRSATRPFGC